MRRKTNINSYGRVVTKRVTGSGQVAIGHGHFLEAVVTPVGGKGNSQVSIYDAVGEMVGHEYADLRSSQAARQGHRMRPYRVGLYVKMSAEGADLIPADKSNDLTTWDQVGAVVTTKTTVEDPNDPGYSNIRLIIPLDEGVEYAWTVWVLKDDLGCDVRYPLFDLTVGGQDIFTLNTKLGSIVVKANPLGSVVDVVEEGIYWKIETVFTPDDGDGLRLRIYPAIGNNPNCSQYVPTAGGKITVPRYKLTTPGGEGSVLVRYVPLRA